MGSNTGENTVTETAGRGSTDRVGEGDGDVDEDGDGTWSELNEAEMAALHQIELGMEWFHRAHGHLVAFHHNTGHAMDHLALAEDHLRECGRDGLADDLRDRHLPQGVIDGGRWSYDVLEGFQAGLLTDLVAFEQRARREVADGRRHVSERRQEHVWKRRARNRTGSGTPTDSGESADDS